jgi:hypothetical protein
MKRHNTVELMPVIIPERLRDLHEAGQMDTDKLPKYRLPLPGANEHSLPDQNSRGSRHRQTTQDGHELC